MLQVNNQAPLRVERNPDGHVYVHSIFRTIQGEGPFAGRAALFVRLAGCNLQCPGCDTEYTSVQVPMAPDVLLHQIRVVHEWTRGLIVITGGEPFRQNITPLVRTILLADVGYQVQIESNGVLYPGDDFPWTTPRMTVVVSPKTGKIHPETAKRAHAYKYVLSYDGRYPDGLPVTALGHPLNGHRHVARPPVGWDGPVYVQPMDSKDPETNDRNLKAVVETVMENPRYIMGVQMHKLTGLP